MSKRVPVKWPAKPTAVSEFIAVVEEIHANWTGRGDYDYAPWFRGHGDARWPLLPGLFRPEFEKTDENSYRHEFQLRAYPFLQDATYRPESDWDWYFLMQHHGLPTRLLDWTESALTALYFAVSSARTADAGVWMLNPWKLNDLVADIGEHLGITTTPRIKPYLYPPWDKTPIPETPAAIQPPFNSRRIAAQRGAFTIHGAARLPIETYTKLRGHLSLITIPRQKLPNFSNQLARAGVSESLLFPELTGLCREIREKWKGVS